MEGSDARVSSVSAAISLPAVGTVLGVAASTMDSIAAVSAVVVTSVASAYFSVASEFEVPAEAGVVPQPVKRIASKKAIIRTTKGLLIVYLSLPYVYSKWSQRSIRDFVILAKCYVKNLRG